MPGARSVTSICSWNQPHPLIHNPCDHDLSGHIRNTKGKRCFQLSDHIPHSIYHWTRVWSNCHFTSSVSSMTISPSATWSTFENVSGMVITGAIITIRGQNYWSCNRIHKYWMYLCCHSAQILTKMVRPATHNGHDRHVWTHAIIISSSQPRRPCIAQVLPTYNSITASVRLPADVRW